MESTDTFGLEEAFIQLQAMAVSLGCTPELSNGEQTAKLGMDPEELKNTMILLIAAYQLPMNQNSFSVLFRAMIYGYYHGQRGLKGATNELPIQESK